MYIIKFLYNGRINKKNRKRMFFSLSITSSIRTSSITLFNWWKFISSLSIYIIINSSISYWITSFFLFFILYKFKRNSSSYITSYTWWLCLFSLSFIKNNFTSIITYINWKRMFFLLYIIIFNSLSFTTIFITRYLF